MKRQQNVRERQCRTATSPPAARATPGRMSTFAAASDRSTEVASLSLAASLRRGEEARAAGSTAVSCGTAGGPRVLQWAPWRAGSSKGREGQQVGQREAGQWRRALCPPIAGRTKEMANPV